jgi:hypothetical protein
MKYLTILMTAAALTFGGVSTVTAGEYQPRTQAEQYKAPPKAPVKKVSQRGEQAFAAAPSANPGPEAAVGIGAIALVLLLAL